MITATALAAHLDTLAVDLDDDGNMSTGSRKTDKIEKGLKKLIFKNGTARCVYCGEAGNSDTRGPLVLCHFLPAGPRRMGWHEGNIGPGHAACNDLVSNVDHRPFLSALTLDDVILTWGKIIPEAGADRAELRAILNGKGIPTVK